MLKRFLESMDEQLGLLGHVTLAALVTSVGTMIAAPAMASDDSLTVTVGMIWEGEPVSPANLSALNAFRNQFKSVKLVHLISPVYFTRGHKDIRSREAHFKQMREMIYPGDLAGIYLNGWKSLAEAANVPFKNSPTFWGNKLNVKSCIDDCGREVLMTAYSPSDIRKILKKSRQLFNKQGFGEARLLQVAGHAASPEILAAASAEGMTHDFSAISTDHFSGRLYRFPLMATINELWSGVGPVMRPFTLKTGDDSITQMTANGLLLETMAESDILRNLDRMTGSGEGSPLPEGVSHFFIGFPLETIAMTVPKLELSVQELFRRSSARKFAIKWFADAASGVSANQPSIKVDSAH